MPRPTRSPQRRGSLVWEPTVEQYVAVRREVPGACARRPTCAASRSMSCRARRSRHRRSRSCSVRRATRPASLSTPTRASAADVAWLVGCWLGDGKYQQPTITMASVPTSARCVERRSSARSSVLPRRVWARSASASTRSRCATSAISRATGTCSSPTAFPSHEVGARRPGVCWHV
jgi:hypothetical protein